MSKQQTVIMVPAKAVRQDLKTETNTIVYMPLATTQNPGVVQVGEGLLINSEGLLSFDQSEITIAQIAKNGVIITPDENKIVNIVLNKYDVGLDNVDNTSDINKPVSIYQQQALNTKLDKYVGEAYKNKALVVGEDGVVTYKQINVFKTYNDNKLVTENTDVFNFSSIFDVTAVDAKSVNIDGSTALKNAFKSVSYNASNGVLSFERVNGSVLSLDLPLELLIKSGYYKDETKEIILVLANGESIKIPVAELVNNYYADEDSIVLTYVNDKLTFSVKNGGITSKKIADNSVGDSKIVSVSGTKVVGPVDEALYANNATNDSLGNNISNTYRKITDSYNKSEISDLLSNYAKTEAQPTITIYGGF